MPDPTGRISHLPEMHRGVSWKQPVRAASTANLPDLATDIATGASVDGVTLAAGDRVLVKNQGTATANGIYQVAGTPFRAFDMDQDEASSVPAAEIVGSFVYVTEGTTNGATLWYATTTGTPNLDVDAITFAEWGSSTGTAYVTKTDGGSETVYTDSAVSGTAYTINIEAGNWQDLTLTGTATCTFAFSGFDSGEGDSCVVLLRQDGTGSRGPAAWSAAVVWPDDTAPTLGTAAYAIDVLTFLSRDGGATIFGFHAGGGGGGSAGTPGLTLSTSNAQGAASTFVATDATIALFDATAPTTLAYDDDAATGAAAYAARRDHVHGMPSAQGGIGEILITDTPSGTPIAFVDLLLDETELDLLYADP